MLKKREYVLVIVLMVMVVALVSVQKKYSKEIEAIKGRLQIISNAKTVLGETLKKAIRQKREYKFSLQDERERNRLLNDQLRDLFSEMEQKKSQILTLNSELEDLRDESGVLKGRLNQISTEKNLLNEQLSSLQKIQENLQKKIRRLLTRTKVELGEVVVKPANLNGKVLKANRKYNFVIIDLGKNDGVRVGMNLTAYREEKPIGEIKIEKIYNELSVGSASFEWLGNELDVGDTIRGKD